MDTLDQLREMLWSSDYVQTNPKKSYKNAYNEEYLAIAQYFSGGSRPDTSSYSKLGRVLVGLEDHARAEETPDPTPDPDPTPLPVGQGELGLNTNAAPSDAWLSRASTLNPKWLREENRDDVMVQKKIDWIKARNGQFIYLLLPVNRGLAACKTEVDKFVGKVACFELDNEPYFANVNTKAWANLVLDLAKYIRSKGGKTVLPMLVQTNDGNYFTDTNGNHNPTSGGQWKPWATQVMDFAPDLKNYVDFISAHPYAEGRSPNAPDGQGRYLWKIIDRVRGELQSKGLDKPWHMTEFGWSVGTAAGLQVSAAQQAQYLEELMVEARKRPWIASCEWYCLQTWGAGYQESFGIFNQDMSDRPASVKFRALV